MATEKFTRACKRCGSGFLTNGSGKHFYCGPHCRDSAREESQQAAYLRKKELRGPCEIAGCTGLAQAKGMCPKHYFRLRAHGDPLFTKHGLRVQKACKTCGKGMFHKPSISKKRDYCSRACQAVGAVTAKGLPHRGMVVRGCRCCGSCIDRKNKPERDSGVFCSRSCYEIVRTTVRLEREWLRAVGDKGRVAREAYQPPPNLLVVAEIDALKRISRYVERPSRRKCGGCDTLILRSQWTRLCPACKDRGKKASARKTRQSPSYKAAKLKYKSVRRAREAIEAELVNPYVVFSHAGWTCQLCGVPTPRSLRGTYEPNAPEIDHIIPLAKGGGHTWANVQCACRQCNQRKGASLAA